MKGSHIFLRKTILNLKCKKVILILSENLLSSSSEIINELYLTTTLSYELN